MNPKVDFYFSKGKWQKEIQKLRTIALDCGLKEELKWGCPCYTLKQSNVVLIHVFKDYCALLFFKGALLKNEDGLLIQQTENVQAARQMRFTGLKEIAKAERSVKAAIYEVIEVEKLGLKVKLKKTSEFKIPEEFQIHLNKNKKLKTAFEGLTAGRQRAYLFHFAQPKLSKTREARVEKNLKRILSGKGLDD